MKLAVMAILLSAGLCYGQEPGDIKPATSNVLDSQYPKVDSDSRVHCKHHSARVRILVQSVASFPHHSIPQVPSIG